MTQDTPAPYDAMALATSLDLDPCNRSGAEARIRCPMGCDEGRPRSEYGCSLHVAADERCGVWHCWRCGEAGPLRAQAPRHWAPDPSQPPPRERPLPEPVDVEAAWAVLAAARYRFAGEIRAWAERRGWPPTLAEAVASSPDVAWAPPRALGHEGADRLAEHARYAERPLLVAVRDAAGAVVTVQRRRAGPGEPPKAKLAWRGLCRTTEGAPLIFGAVDAWADAVAAGGVGALVEGEVDYLALQAMIATGAAGGVGAVLACPAAAGLWGLGEAAGRALAARSVVRGRVVLVPHLGDTGRHAAQIDKGEKAMGGAGAALRKQAPSTLISTLHLRPLTGGKADLADVLERCGAADVARQLAEVAPLQVTDGDVRTWRWDDAMVEEGAEAAHTLARRCWPVALTRRVEGGEHGLRYRYVTRQGAVRYGVLPASAWADRNAAQTAARAAAEAGVEILPGQGSAWALALGQWATRTWGAPTVAVVRRPGWHLGGEPGPVYVHGTGCHGADWIYDGPEVRTRRAGDVAAWGAGVDALCDTPALMLALGVALAGALVEPLGAPLFIVHLAGRSSSGKTSAGRLAASVWARPCDVVPYNGTGLGLTLTAEALNGGCIALDEIKEMRGDDLARVIHTLTDGRSRTMARRDGEDVRASRRWALTALSTGEVTVAEHLGRSAQGGQAVRAIDLRVQLGEVTRDAAHAVALARWLEGCHGVCGEAWGAWLQALPTERWGALAAAQDALTAAALEQSGLTREGDPELERVARSLALCGVALEEATRAGVIGTGVPEGFGAALVAWALARVAQERGGVTSPETRALRALRELFESAPGRFPPDREYRTGRHGDVVGVTLSEPDTSTPPRATLTGAIVTTEGMLKASGALVAAGVGPRRFLEWCAEQGIGDGGRRWRVGGVLARWHRIDLSEPQEVDGDA